LRGFGDAHLRVEAEATEAVAELQVKRAAGKEMAEEGEAVTAAAR